MHAISTNDVASLASLTVEGAMTTVETPDGAGGTRLTRRPFEPERYRTGAFRERYWDPVGTCAAGWPSSGRRTSSGATARRRTAAST
jgi:hypothetical protein